MIILVLAGCKKESEFPHLTFSKEESQWFIYRVGQEFKFKNELGDSLVYTVTDVQHDNKTPEFKDTSFSVVIGYSETYLARLLSNTDSIIVYFYKQLQSTDPNKMRQTIRWISVKGQFVYLSAIENYTSFTSRTINGVTYSKVTEAFPHSEMIYPFTKFDRAYYDQKAGFIEIIDLNGTSWKRS